ncbi:MAG: hypothetical protein ACRD3J_21715, partial [Thermoanaerobaculia bacterium]
PLQVLVIAFDNVVVFPMNLTIPFGYNGTIVWTLSGAGGLEFTEPGVQFNEAAPYTVQSVGPHTIQAAVSNNNPNVTGTPFAYTLFFTDEGKTTEFDPTVENDSPPPPTP